MAAKPPPAPRGCRAAGRRLWRSLTAEYEFSEAELQVVTQMVRIVDRLDEFERVLAETGSVDESGEVSRVAIEARQQALALARLTASLRLPAAEGEEHSRPQTRSLRGVYGGAA